MSTRTTSLHNLLNIDNDDAALRPQPIHVEGGQPLFDYAGLPGLQTVSEPELNGDEILIRTRQVGTLDCCPKCGCPFGAQFKRNGTRTQYLHDEPRGLWSVRVEVRRQSYRCMRCKAVPKQPLAGVKANRHLTTRLLRYVQLHSCLESFSAVAFRTGLSDSTVRDIFNDYVARLDQVVRFDTPRVLGLDGVYIGGKECAILTDLEAGLVIDLWADYRLDDLVAGLKRLPNREHIQVVVIDMSRLLRRAVQEALPQAVIVIDRHHITTLANEGVDRVRQQLRRDILRRKGQLTMCRRELLRKHLHQLEPDQQKDLKQWFELQPKLKLAYDIKESFFEIWYSSSIETARQRYREWLGTFPPDEAHRFLTVGFKKVLTAMRNWEEYVLNYFNHPYTNAFTERSNGKIKDFLRAARGSTFETARAKIIYGTLIRQLMSDPTKKRRPAKRALPRSGPTAPPAPQTSLLDSLSGSTG
jgi:transposase